MTLRRIGAPPAQMGAVSAAVADSSPRRTARAIAVVALMIVAISVAHLLTETTTSTVPLHALYRRLYFVPIVYAAWVFGKKGGIVTAVASALLYGLHARLQLHSVVPLGGFDDWIEIVSYLGVGLLFGAVRDVEEKRNRDLQLVSIQLEEAYRKLEERAIQLINVQDYTSSILRSITSGVITVGPDGSVATANPAAERMLRMSELEMVPKPIKALFADDGGVAGDVDKVLSGRIPMALRDTTLTTVAGHEVHVQVSVSRMRAVGGTVLGAVVTLEDVSDVKALTDQLIRSDRLAAMGELTAGVAHEVRNPLGVIRGSVQLLEDTRDPRRVREAAEVIKQEIDRLDKVIKALLDFGRPSRPTFMSTDLGQVLEDVVLFTDRFARQANARIILNGLPLIPPVRGDADQLKQVFLNLVTNAVQAMEESGGEITIDAMVNDDYVTVSVADTGVGIAPEDLPKIFDPFFTKRAEGTGLGLTIVHRIIDEHDGHIAVESSEGGTTFRVSLPLEYRE